MKLSPEQREEWGKEMPVLAAIVRTNYGGRGDFVKTTQFGDLYLDGDKYTLVTGGTQPVETPSTDSGEASRLPWRTGQKLGRTLYGQLGDEPSDEDPLLGLMETKALAEQVVAAVNDSGEASQAPRCWGRYDGITADHKVQVERPKGVGWFEVPCCPPDQDSEEDR